MAKSFKVKLKKSTISCNQAQRNTVRCLGLRGVNSEVTVKDSPAVRGQIMMVQHLLEVEVVK